MSIKITEIMFGTSCHVCGHQFEIAVRLDRAMNFPNQCCECCSVLDTSEVADFILEKRAHRVANANL